jgi:hypothetical protein
VAKAPFDASLLWEGKLAQRPCATREPAGVAALASWIHEHGVEPVHACLEAAGEDGAALALVRYDSGQLVGIVTPARIAASAKRRLARTTTDTTEAARIGRFWANEPPPVCPPRGGGAGTAAARWSGASSCGRNWGSRRRRSIVARAAVA